MCVVALYSCTLLWHCAHECVVALVCVAALAIVSLCVVANVGAAELAPRCMAPAF